MMYSKIKWLIPVALTCAAFGVNIQNAKAQASVNREFEITYDALTTLAPIENQPGFLTANIIGTSQDSNAPFGFNNFESNAFGALVSASEETITDPSGNVVPVIQNFEFNANPAVIGLANPPQSFIDKRAALGIPNPEENSDIYFGNSANKLFGKAADRATINLSEGTISGEGIITVTGGTGIFENASGEIEFEQSDRLPEDPNAAALGAATLTFNIQTPQSVPESTDALGLAAGVLGVGLIVRQKRR